MKGVGRSEEMEVGERWRRRLKSDWGGEKGGRRMVVSVAWTLAAAGGSGCGRLLRWSPSSHACKLRWQEGRM